MDDQLIEHMYTKITEIYAIVVELERTFPGRHFTPDGHMVGSIGEVLAAYIYDLKLFTASTEKHDAVSADGIRVQIKATQSDKTIGLKSEPEHLIVLRIYKDGKASEIYNGPGNPVWQATGPKQSNGSKYVGVTKLKEIGKTIPETEKIQKVRG